MFDQNCHSVEKNASGSQRVEVESFGFTCCVLLAV